LSVCLYVLLFTLLFFLFYMRNFHLLAKLSAWLTCQRRPQSNFNICLPFFASVVVGVAVCLALPRFGRTQTQTEPHSHIAPSLSPRPETGQGFICFIRFYCCFHFSLPKCMKCVSATHKIKKETHKLTTTK